MKAKMIVPAVCCILVLFLLGFQNAPQQAVNWEYKVVEVRTHSANELQSALRNHVKNGWILDQPLILPVDTNWNMSRCFLVLKKQR